MLSVPSVALYLNILLNSYSLGKKNLIYIYIFNTALNDTYFKRNIYHREREELGLNSTPIPNIIFSYRKSHHLLCTDRPLAFSSLKEYKNFHFPITELNRLEKSFNV